jgi:hypothetical protein
VRLLVRACRLGLHRQAADIVPLIDTHVAEDPAFVSVVTGLSQLELLVRSREPLEATQLKAVPRLMTAAYQRACRLASDLAGCPDEVVDPAIAALRGLREVLAGAAGARDEDQAEFDPELFHAALRHIVADSSSSAQPAVVGAAAGVLYGDGVLTEAELMRLLRGTLGGATSDPRRSCGLLRGLLATAREAAWQVAELARALDAQFRAWDEKAFLASLPELRLAFADLTPREIARVAEHVTGLHGGAQLGELVHADVSENDMRLAVDLTHRVRESLVPQPRRPPGPAPRSRLARPIAAQRPALARGGQGAVSEADL